MPKREVTQSITLVRAKQRVQLKAGQVFDFTADELAQIERSNPNAVSRTRTVDIDDPSASLRTETKLDANAVAPPAAGQKAAGVAETDL